MMQPDDGLGVDGGWTASSEAWIKLAPDHASRTLLLDPVMLREAGDVAGLRTLDVGCGEGRFTRLLAARGATAIGLDPIDALLQAGRAQASERERYLLGSGEALPFCDESLDLVFIYLALIDIPDFRTAIRESARVLKPGGRVLAANVSNIASSAEPPERDADGRYTAFVIDDYQDERSRAVEFGGVRIRNWHRPLSAYMDAYLSVGFTLRRFIEPVPDDASLRENADFGIWFRVPTFDVQVWEKG